MKINGANGAPLNGNPCIAVNGHAGTLGDTASNGEKRGSGRTAATISPAHADRQLIDLALAGDATAWEGLYQQCHRPLITAIRGMLRGRAVDTNLVDELAARVWYAVVREQGELLTRFDPARGCRLTTYLATIAKDEAGRLFRSERPPPPPRSRKLRHAHSHRLQRIPGRPHFGHNGRVRGDTNPF